jgi:hypothetical protein
MAPVVLVVAAPNRATIGPNGALDSGNAGGTLYG